MKRIAFLLMCLVLTAAPLPAVSLDNGSATIDYDPAAWQLLAAASGYPQPVLQLSAFFDQAQSTAMDYNEILKSPRASPSYTTQSYVMNGATVTNLTLRTAQPTTFEYRPGELPAHTGVIGLGGISRFAVSGGGSLLFGDFTLQYDVARQARGGTGWYLKGNIAPAAAAFDLLDVQVVESPGSFTLSGRLGVSFEVANFLLVTPADTLRVVGTFEFRGYVDPVVVRPPVIERIEVLDSQVRLHSRDGNPGGRYAVESSLEPGRPGASWVEVGSGTFDAQGATVDVLAFDSGETSRAYRLRLP